MDKLIERAPMVRRVGELILPISQNDILYQKEESFYSACRIIDNAQTVIEGLLTAVISPDIVEDTGANFTPDLLGKAIYRLTSTNNTNADGTVTRVPEDGGAATISEVISPTRLRLNKRAFTGNSSKYYAIDNHAGEITDSTNGFITTDTASKIIDANANFDASMVGKYAAVYDGNAWFRALISTVDSTTQLTLEIDLPTSVGNPYMIINSDDAFRFIGSALLDYGLTKCTTLNIILKDGTYRESLHIQSKETNGDSANIIIVGDINQGAKTILSGSYSTTPTIRSFNTFAYISKQAILFIGLKFSYYNSSIVPRFSTITFYNCFFSNIAYLMDAALQCSVSIDTCRIATMSGIVVSQGTVVLFFFGAITMDTNVAINSVFNKGITIITYDNPTITGAGSITGGTALQGVFAGHWNGAINVPHLTDGSGVWEKYFETTKTAATATAGAATLPANPEGFMLVYINGVQKKIPYYAA